MGRASLLLRSLSQLCASHQSGIGKDFATLRAVKFHAVTRRGLRLHNVVRVVGVYDSMMVARSDQDMAQLMRQRAGVGSLLYVRTLRKKGSLTRHVTRAATNPF